MVNIPRFLRHNGSYSLVMVRLNKGVIEDVSAPILLAGAESPEALIKTADLMLGRALHESPVLEISDLPEDLQARYQPESA